MGEIVLALISAGKEFINFFLPWTVLDEYERGIVLRLGRPRKKRKGKLLRRIGEEEGVIGPGIIWHHPFKIDVVLQTNVVYETGEAADLTVLTKDGLSVNAHAIAGYSVSNVRKFLLEVEEAGDVILDAVGGSVTQAIRSRSLESVLSPDFDESVRRESVRRFIKYGAKLESLYFHVLTPLGMKYGVIKVLTG